MGMYDKYLTGDVATNYSLALTEIDQLDLSRELALMRSQLGGVIEELKTATDAKAEGRLLSRMERLVKEIRQLSASVAKNIEHSAAYIPISFVPVLLSEIVETIRKEIGDDNVVERLRHKLNKLSLPANGAEAETVRNLREKSG